MTTFTFFQALLLGSEMWEEGFLETLRTGICYVINKQSVWVLKHADSDSYDGISIIKFNSLKVATSSFIDFLSKGKFKAFLLLVI